MPLPKRIPALAMAAAMTLLTGCGVGSSGPQGGLTVDYMKSGTYDKAAEGLAGDFKKSTGTSVDVQSFPYATLRQNNVNAAIAGTCQYNVVSGSYYLAPIYDKFASLDNLANQSNYAEKLLPGLWDRSEIFNGQHIGVPYGPDSYGTMIRTDLFTEAGLSVPTSWQELLNDLGVLKTKFASQGIDPFVFSGGAPEQLPALLFAGYDGYFINKDGKYELDPTKAAAAIRLGQSLMSFAPKNASSLTIDSATAQFTSGKAAVLYGFPSFVVQAANKSDAVKGKWAVIPNPGPGFTWLSLWQMYMTKCTDNKDAAWKWMTTFSSESNDKAFFTQYGINPSFASTYKDPDLLKTYGNYLPGEAANISKAKNPPLSGEAQDFMASTLGEVFVGGASPEDAVAKINAKWKTLSVPDALAERAKIDGLVQK